MGLKSGLIKEGGRPTSTTNLLRTEGVPTDLRSRKERTGPVCLESSHPTQNVRNLDSVTFRQGTSSPGRARQGQHTTNDRRTWYEGTGVYGGTEDNRTRTTGSEVIRDTREKGVGSTEGHSGRKTGIPVPGIDYPRCHYNKISSRYLSVQEPFSKVFSTSFRNHYHQLKTP